MKKNHDLKYFGNLACRLAGRLQYVIWVLLLSSSSEISFSQTISVKASIDKDRILIGEPVQLQLQAKLPMGRDANWFPVDTIPHFEFIEQGRIDTVQSMEGKAYKQVLTITSFDSGQWVIPSLILEVDGKSYRTDSLPVSVAFSHFNPEQEYHDIKDILEIENPNTKYVNWALGALTLLSLLAVAYLLRKHSSGFVQQISKNELGLTPFEEAMRSLDELKNQQLSEHGQVKLYYTTLNDILRSFISKEMAMSTMQKTNQELMSKVKETGISNDVLHSLEQTLRMSDAVKFAKFIPDHEHNERNLQTIKSGIQALNNVRK